MTMTILGRMLPALLAVLLAPAMALAGALSLDGDFTQGGLVYGTTEPGARVSFRGRDMRVSAAGAFLIGFGRDDEGPFELSVHHPDGSHTRRSIEIAGRDYAVQRIDGLPPKMVTPPPETLARIRRENGWIAKVRARDTAEPFFVSGFVWPATGPISGVYGSRRILNGEPRRPHFGVDVAAPAGSPVVAPSPGIVALAEKDLYYTGGTVMIDHGHGLTSVFSHMSAVLVRVGERIKQGVLIGRIGATGRVTGPHLDWRVNLFKTRLDPQRLVPPMPAQ